MASLQRKYDRRIPDLPQIIVLGFALFFPLAALAEEPPAKSPSATTPSTGTAPAATSPVVTLYPEAPLAEVSESPSFIDPILDVPREYVSEKFVNLANNVDAFFGSDRNYQESNKSVLQFDLTRVVQDAGSKKIVPAFRAKLHLPGLQNRLHSWQQSLHLLLETNPDKNLPGTGAGVTTSQDKTPLFKEVATPDSYGVALRLENTGDSPWHLSADAGLKLVGANDVMKLNHTGLDPFVRARTSFIKPMGAAQLSLAESVFWYNTIGAGENTQFDAEYNITKRLLFRATSSATWLHEQQNLDLRQDFSFYQTLDDRHSLLYQFSAIGNSQPHTDVSEYVILLLYRQRLRRDWIFLELSPQMHYLEVNNYQPEAQFVIRLEILFSK
ncbi:MAG: hypothetical protein FD173_1367 [Gallionellaceae bacterium]|nr:MAG: hypothetical protein FD173_1367 [Gallionellaceae bacterium]